ncbi:MAG: DASH family cryptochrome [Bacteroidetes bacterium]|nr:DASH family cryptochrome [Bacteroidota bacterium]MDA0859419.1 DASH family cryptochrome [Bacteroidota bacterium]MDA1317994.1 DASH family cryptochrome [Bacteroidota bacterium]
MQQQKDISLVWFRNDLRTQDNTVLQSALSTSKQVIGVYFLESNMFKINKYGFKKMEKFRVKFLLETLNCLQQELHKLNITLLVYQDSAKEQMKHIVETHNVSTIYLQKEWTDEENTTFNDVKNSLANTVSFYEVYDQFLFHPEDIPFHFIETPKVFTHFRKQLEKKAKVRSLTKIHPQSASFLLETTTKIPTLKDLGYEDFEIDTRTVFPFLGGENAAFQRLEHYFFETKAIGVYKKTRNGLLGVNYSSKFSPWLANGSLSARQIFWNIKEFESQFFSNQSTYWLIFELIWRDFFKYVSLKHGNEIFKIDGILKQQYEWSNHQKYVNEWIHGETSDDFVNANMLELKNTGWMSNRGRQNVASFFAKTQKLDWRVGAAYFESMLVDYDVHSNYGNWMYVSGVGNDPRDRFFNVKLQAERYDSNQKYRKQWLQSKLF